MVNASLNWASIVGIVLAVGGALLYFMRSFKPALARDYDVFFAAIGLLCGGILFFQGWRLDPILQFGQFLLASTTVFFAYESVRLRGVSTEQARRSAYFDDEPAPVRDPAGGLNGGWIRPTTGLTTLSLNPFAAASKAAPTTVTAIRMATHRIFIAPAGPPALPSLSKPQAAVATVMNPATTGTNAAANGNAGWPVSASGMTQPRSAPPSASAAISAKSNAAAVAPVPPA